MTKISVVIPVFNEEETIIGVLERVREQAVKGVTFEVVVVNDGSSDSTPEKLDAHPELYEQVIHMAQNGGKGAAVKAGLAAATGEYILFQDADLEYDPADYAKLLLPVTEFSADVVMGSRMVGPEFTRVHYFWNKIGNKVITFLFDLLFNSTFTDIYSCYLMYRRSLLDPAELVSEGWEQQAEILCRIIPRASSVYEVPINYRGRTYEEGKKIRAYHAAIVMFTIVLRRFVRGSVVPATGLQGNPSELETKSRT